MRRIYLRLGQFRDATGQPHAYLCFGVEDRTHNVVGTTVRLKSEKAGTKPFENWVSRKFDPRLNMTVIPFDYDGNHIEMIIELAYQRPVRVDGELHNYSTNLARLNHYNNIRAPTR
jgi:predicted HTH transcriptional regulator